jgi:putative SOS response-associated peptidase YedK
MIRCRHVRFTRHYTWREIHELYGLVGAARNLEPRHNLAPSSTIDVALPTVDGPALVPMRWGLIPSWWKWWKKTAKEVPSTFNARAESVAEMPMFRSAFKRNRCIIPAWGYFEWKPMPNGKQPYFISAADGGVLSIAGLWDRWHTTDTGETVLSCTMIVTDANAFTRAVHKRLLFSSGAVCPDEPPPIQPQTRPTASCLTPIQLDGLPMRDCKPVAQKKLLVVDDCG